MEWLPAVDLDGPAYAIRDFSYHRHHYTPATQPLYSSVDHSAAYRRSRPRFLTLTSKPRLPSPPATLTPEPFSKKASPFLRIPAEIRLQIYALLVLPHDSKHLRPSYEKIKISVPDNYNHDADLSSMAAEPTIMIRSIDPSRYAMRYPAAGEHSRKSYKIRSSGLQSRCVETTYHCINNPRIEDNLAIMRTNPRIHAEVCELLYGHYTFDFDTHVEAMIPFLSDLTPFARSCIRSIRFVKRALPYEKEFDRCEWSNALRYLTTRGNNINLRRLQLGVIAGRPGRTGWDRTAKYSAADFAQLVHTNGMEWMQYLLEINRLESLDVQAVVEHCPSTQSSAAMARYVRFSASVEHGFTDFLRSRLLARPHEQLACRL